MPYPRQTLLLCYMLLLVAEELLKELLEHEGFDFLILEKNSLGLLKEIMTVTSVYLYKYFIFHMQINCY